MAGHLFTSESVTEGHPDKVCDAISDSILDAIIEQDPKARVACETMVKTGYAIVAGEITTHAWVNVPKVVRTAIREIGYTSSEMGFDAGSCAQPGNPSRAENRRGRTQDDTQAEHPTRSA